MLRKVSLSLLILVVSFVSMFSYIEVAEASFESTVDTAILVDADTGNILYEQNAEVPLPPASMTKMMSEYLVLEAIHNGSISWDQVVPISEFLASLSHNRGLSNVPMRIDREYTVEELYESVAIYSANASTMVLTELIAGSEGAFVEMMNEKGKELGLGKLLREEGAEYGLDNLKEIFEAELGDFQFVNSTGLPNRLLEGQHPEGTGENEDNYMSAMATATLAYHLVNDFPEVLDTASIPRKIFREGTSDAIEMLNWNWMLEGTRNPNLDYEYIDGLKTGFTNAARYTFTGTAEKDGQRLISVVMGAESEEHRFTETERLLEWGFEHFSVQEVLAGDLTLQGYEMLPVKKGKEDQVAIASTDSISLLIHKDDVDAYSYSVQIDSDQLSEEGKLEAPVEVGQVVGRLILEYNGEKEQKFLPGEGQIQTTVDIVTIEEVERAGWFSLLMRGISGFFSGIWTSVSDTVRGWF